MAFLAPARLFIVALVAVVSLGSLMPAAALAQAGESARREDIPERSELDDLATAAPDEELSPGLERLPLRGAGFEGAATALRQALAAMDHARFLALRAQTEVYALQGALRRDRALAIALADDAAAIDLALDDVRAALRSVAVAQFVQNGSTTDPAVVAVAGGDVYESQQVRSLTSDLTPDLQVVQEQLLTDRDHNESATTDVSQRIAQTSAALRTKRSLLDDANRQIDDAKAQLPGLAAAVRDSRWLATVVGLELPLVVLDAYVRAATEESVATPGCDVQWWMLAGIGRVESGHGTFGGTTVGADGRTVVEIIGIPLNGTQQTAVITDSDGGRLDRDPIFDRAVGPMQFIPTTWASVGLDGNGDGTADPHNLYDAARSSARYLCLTGGGTLLDPTNLGRAYFAYNHDNEYVLKVFGYAVDYRTFVIG